MSPFKYFKPALSILLPRVEREKFNLNTSLKNRNRIHVKYIIQLSFSPLANQGGWGLGMGIIEGWGGLKGKGKREVFEMKRGGK